MIEQDRPQGGGAMMPTQRPVNPVTEIEHCWIEMPDGVRLAARLWLPDGVGAVPAILEYIPYRKRDMVRARDERNHPFFAANGYACLRVDMRGSGDSEGVMPDMYADAELEDARHVIDWIARQDWCNGRVGMFGTSWGGTASLQAAVDAPAPLKAVIANCATINRFEDDIHWMGGCVLTDTLEWAATLPAILAAPPDSATVGDQWMEQWKARLRGITLPHLNWLRETRRHPYWARGSVHLATDRLSCPVLAIGGWSDRYSNSVMPLVSARPDLCRGIVGPWGHHYPDHGEPGPALSFQLVALEWWDSWLKGKNARVDSWPALRVWEREFDVPQDRLETRNGQWIELQGVAEGGRNRLHLTMDGLSQEPDESGAVRDVPFDLAHGACAGDTGYFGRVGGLPLDQAADDGRSLCFDSAVLAEEMTVFGHAELEVRIIPDKLPAQLACRLCDVAPDGQSNLIARAVLNLEMDGALDGPSGATAGEELTLRMVFPSCAYRLRAGHRLRLAIGSSYWPLLWPAPATSQSRLVPGGSCLSLPTIPSEAGPLSLPMPEALDLPAEKGWTVSTRGALQRRQATITAEGQVESGWHQPETTILFDAAGIGFSYETKVDYLCPLDHPAQARCTVNHRLTILRPDGEAVISSMVSHVNAAAGGQTVARVEARWQGATIGEMDYGPEQVDPSAPSPTMTLR